MADVVKRTNIAINDSGDLKANFQPDIERFDLTTKKVSSGTQTVGTTAENLRVGDVSSFGLLCITNKDDTNFVQFGVDSSGFVAAGRVPPGRSVEFWCEPGTTPQVKADTAACEINFLLAST